LRSCLPWARFGFPELSLRNLLAALEICVFGAKICDVTVELPDLCVAITQ